MLSARWSAGVGGSPVIRRPRAFTLAELVLVLALGSLLLALVVSIGNTLQRELGQAAERMASADQLRGAAAILPLDLRALSSAAGDIHAGEARDTSLQANITVASGIVCAASADTIVLAPFAGPTGQAASATVQEGDNLWILVDGDSAEEWHAMPARAVGSASGCPALSPVAGGASPFVVERTLSIRVGAEHAAIARRGAPVRVTRPARYSLYRSSDGRWYLGLHSWSTDLARFAAVQPVSGPYRSATDAANGTRLRYFDASGVLVPSGALDTRRITRIEARLVPEQTLPARPAGNDSLILVVSLRNAR